MLRMSLSIVALLAMSGCSGAPIVGFGLTSSPAGDQVGASRTAPVKSRGSSDRVQHAAARQMRKPVIEMPSEPAETTASPESDDPGDRATHAMDSHVQQLESAAERATNSICRGC